jgi:histidinol-phosphate/aromatic aminotransferase/cobyric acid decarboxylase-like protein
MSRFWSPVVHSLSPYVPGEQPKLDGIIKLNTNENPYPPSPRVLAAIASAADRLRLYPDPRAHLDFEVLPSVANFVFARHRRQSGAQLAAKLRERGVLVRHFQKPRIADYLRITVGTEDQCSRLIDLTRSLI